MKVTCTIPALLLTLAVVIGCPGAPEEKPTKANSGNAAAKPVGDVGKPVVEGRTITPGEYAFEPSHAQVYFKIPHLEMSNTYGRFNDVAGTFVLAEEPADSTFEVTIQADSIDTGNEKRDEHLRNPDFFNAGQFPVITFKSTGVELDRATATYNVTGDLTLHGVTKSITIPLLNMGEGEVPDGVFRSGFDTTFTIKRSDYDMKFMVGPVGDEVTLMVSFEGVKQ